jgi:hypothetical protein
MRKQPHSKIVFPAYPYPIKPEAYSPKICLAKAAVHGIDKIHWFIFNNGFFPIRLKRKG